MFEFFKRKSTGKHIFSENIDIFEGVTVLSIVKNNNVIYLNLKKDSFFALDRDGDDALQGRVSIIKFTDESGNDIEFYVAFDESLTFSWSKDDPYMLGQFEMTARALFDFFNEKKIELFSKKSVYQTQYNYIFKAYRKSDHIFMMNRSQTEGYIISSNKIKRGDGHMIINTYWTK